LTYAERYFLLKYFHIATDEDDVDNDKRKPEEAKIVVPTKPQQSVKAVKQPATEENLKNAKLGNYTIEDVKVKYSVTAEQEKNYKL
jgi:hypothetical protein